MVQEIRELYEYNRWANRRALAAAARLSPEDFTRELGSSFPSVRATLAHIVSAEWIWLSRWQGTSPSGVPESWDLSTIDALQERWEEVAREQEAFVAQLTDEALLRDISYHTTRGDHYRTPLWQLLRHVVNHSTYHRGQVTTLLRQLGAEPASTDLILFYRERGARVGVGS